MWILNGRVEARGARTNERANEWDTNIGWCVCSTCALRMEQYNGIRIQWKSYSPADLLVFVDKTHTHTVAVDVFGAGVVAILIVIIYLPLPLSSLPAFSVVVSSSCYSFNVSPESFTTSISIRCAPQTFSLIYFDVERVSLTLTHIHSAGTTPGVSCISFRMLYFVVVVPFHRRLPGLD